MSEKWGRLLRRRSRVARVNQAARKVIEPLEIRLLMTGAYHWPEGPEFRVNEADPVHSRHFSTVAMNAAGDTVIAWQTLILDGSDYGIHALRFDAAGVAQGSVFQVNTYTTGNQITPAIAIDATGDFVVVWQSAGQDGSLNGMYAQRYSDNGTAQGSEFRVNTTTTDDQITPAVAMDDNGNFVVTWERQDGSAVDIYAKRYNAAGIAQTSEFRVNTHLTNPQRSPAIAMEPDGDFVVAWTSLDQDNIGDYGIFAKRYNASAVALGTEFHVNTYTTLDQEFPTVATDATGDIVIAWQSRLLDGSGDNIYAQRYSVGGVPQGSEFRVNSYTTNNQTAPRVAMDGSGNFTIVWVSSAHEGAGLDGIYAQRYSSARLPQQSEFRVHTYTTGNQRVPDVAASANGAFLVTWDSDTRDGVVSSIYAQRYSTFGAADATTIGNRVWNDANGNGIQDVGEPGIVGVSVDLYNSVGSPAMTAGTDAAGQYGFIVPSGSIAFIHFSTPAGMIPARHEVGIDDEIDSDIDRVTGATPPFIGGAPGTIDNSIDAGFSFAASISGVVFFDRNGNGIRDGGEEGVPGFQVYLDLDHDGIADLDEPGVGSALGGSYTINNLLDATYSVVVAEQNLWIEGAIAPLVVSVGAALTGNNIAVRTTVPDKASEAVGGETLVNGHTTFDQDTPKTVMDATGNYVIVWVAYGQDGHTSGIYAQRYDSVGAQQGSEFRVNSYTFDDQYRPAVAMNAAGDFVVVWQSEGQDGDLDGVFAQRYDSTGFSEGSEFQVNTYTTGRQSTPAVAMGADGAFIVTWHSDVDSDVYGRRFDAAGIAQGTEFRVNSYTTDSQISSAVAMTSDGDFVVVWNSPDQGDSDGGIYGQRYNSTGEAQGSEFRINTYATGSQGGQSLAIDNQGNFVVVWQSLNEVYAQRYDAGGIAQGTEFRVNSYTTGTQNRPAVAMDEAGNFTVTWVSSGQDGSSNGVFGQRFSAAGLPQGIEFRVNSYTTATQTLPTVAMSEAGGIVVAWEGGDVGGVNHEIFAQHYSLADRPAVTAGQFVWDAGPQRIEFAFDQDVLASVSTADLVLENLTTSTTIPVGQIAFTSTDSMHIAFSFPTLPNGGSLPDGSYRATLVAADVKNAAGATITVDYAVQFFVLAGDANRDRIVNSYDLIPLAVNFLQTGRTFSEGDFNYDGVVNATDLGILGSRWQLRMDPPALAPPAATPTGVRSRTAARTPTRITDVILR